MSKYYETSSFYSVSPSRENYSYVRENSEIKPTFSGASVHSMTSQNRPRSTSLRKAILMNEENWFAFRARKWKTETNGMSSIDRKTRHPSYQAIIQMGKRIIPLILEDLQREPNHWFSALKIISGQSPVSPVDRGNILRMREEWLKWGIENGYLAR